MPGYAPYVYPHPLVSAPMAAVAASTVVTEFNGDGYRRLFLLHSAGTRLIAIWYLNKSVKGVALPTARANESRSPHYGGRGISRSW